MAPDSSSSQVPDPLVVLMSLLGPPVKSATVALTFGGSAPAYRQVQFRDAWHQGCGH